MPAQAHHSRKPLAVAVALAILFALAPLVVKDQFTIQVLLQILLFGALGAAWNLVGGFLGRISFPLYLIHVMPLLWLRYFIKSRQLGSPYDTLCLALYLAVIVAAAYVLHLLIERPFQRWSQRLVRQRLPADLVAKSTGVA